MWKQFDLALLWRVHHYIWHLLGIFTFTKFCRQMLNLLYHSTQWCYVLTDVEQCNQRHQSSCSHVERLIRHITSVVTSSGNLVKIWARFVCELLSVHTFPCISANANHIQHFCNPLTDEFDASMGTLRTAQRLGLQQKASVSLHPYQELSARGITVF